MPEFLALIKSNSGGECLAKLRFRDPDLSGQTGKDEYFYLWLCAVVYHPEEDILSGVLFEVPAGFEKWHPNFYPMSCRRSTIPQQGLRRGSL